MLSPRVVYVSDFAVVGLDALLARVEAAHALPEELRARLCVQLREPGLATGELLSACVRLRAATRAVGASFLVNDRVDLALALGTDGVHLGRRSVSIVDARALLGASAFVSVACHSLDDVLAAGRAGANAAVLSPIFASPGKGAPLGPGALREARCALDAAGLAGVALLALGGVDAARASACFDAGAAGVAAIRADLTQVLRS